ncbi:histidine phosphatase family protein [Alkalithermobacter paradoxus]|uniref:Phosphoserine phosphatase 1 n=1 Tax=Alkalithermobacter paradoxus TaxID=29349 RepID=A0A1V4I721_9FIRM|nr:phosphoserine phosphatase 1 [[Clostridium] thermoalcaliphilum]
MVRLIFVRHGITEDNENMRLSGFIDSKLSEVGKSQVIKTAIRLKDENIDYIYSSPLSRAFHTAKEICKYANVDVKICEDFREMNFGKFDGLTFNEIKQNYEDDFNKLKEDSFSYKFPSGESLLEFHDRVSKAIDTIISKHKNNTVLISAHSGVIRSAISHILSRNHEYHWNFKIDNCSITIVEVIDGFGVMHTLNNTEHLR